MHDKKNQLTAAVATHLLAHGLAGHGIRALAKAANTSDRMLIYYFGSKDNLLREAMTLIVGGLADQLNSQLGGVERSADDLLAELTETCQTPEWRPMIELWFEIVGSAVRGNEPFNSIANDIAAVFVGWTEAHLQPADRHLAQDLFAHLEGRLLLYALQSDG